MRFRDFIEALDSDWGKGLVGSNLFNKDNVDGHVEIDWREKEYDPAVKRILAYYKILDKSNHLLRSGAINYYKFPPSLVVYIVHEIAKKVGVFNPSNLLLNNGEFSGAGIAQPHFDDEKSKGYIIKYRSEIDKYIK